MTALRGARCRTLLVVLLIVSVNLCLPLASAQNSAAEPPKAPMDLVLLVDMSLTMVGRAGGQNIFPEVKRALKELVDASGPGDNVVLIPYDADVRPRPAAVIYGDQDKAALKAEIDALSANGQWTYTAAAIQRGLGEAKRLDDAQATGKHPKVVVLLTDGMNDPPPAVRGTAAEVHLNEVARRFQGMPWFVWQVQLGPKIDADVDKAFQGFSNYRSVRTPAADLNKVRADILKAVEAENARQASERAAAEQKKKAAQDEESRRAMEKARQREQAEAKKRAEAEAKEREAHRVQEEAARRAARQRMAVAASAVVGLGIVVLAIIMMRRRPRPHGSLQYWRPGESPRTFDIAGPGKRKLRLGPATGDLVLTGLGERGLTLSAARVEGQVLCVIEADEGVGLTFRGKPVSRLELYDRDQFQLGDYNLQYEGEVGSRTE